MNMKKIFKHILLSALMIATVASCADDRNNFLPEDSFGFNNKAGENVLDIPIYNGICSLDVIKSGKGLNEGVVNVSSDLDSALAVFNKANNTSYAALPADGDFYSISVESLAFGIDDVTKPVEITWDVKKVSDYMNKHPENPVCIPVVLKSDVLEVNEGRELVVINLSKSTLRAVQTILSKAFLWETKAGKTEMSINVKLDRAIDTQDMNVNFAIDKSLVAQYNAENETAYELAPEGLITLGQNPVILAGKNDGALPVTLNTEVLVDPATGLIKRDWDGYVLPVRMNSVSIDGVLFGNALTYIVVKGIKPVENQPFKRIWGFYSDGAQEIPWFLNNGLSITGLNTNGGFKGDDRSFTMNDEFVFITSSSATPGVHKFDVETGEYKGSLNVNGWMKDPCLGKDEVGNLTITYPTYASSCPRMVPNDNPDINNGEDILVIGGLAEGVGTSLRIYAYLNGIDDKATKVYDLSAARRFGDKMSFAGTWKSGKFWFRANETGNPLVANIPVTDGTVQTWIAPHAMIAAETVGCMSEVYWTPQADGTVQNYCLIGTNSDSNGASLYLMTGTAIEADGTIAKSYSNLGNTFGWNFFEFNGRKLMAFVDVIDKTRPMLRVIEGDYSTFEGLQAALDAYSAETALFSAPLQDELDPEVVGFTEGIFIGDCCVRTIGEEVYVAAGVNCVGISMFKLNKNFF